MVQGGCGLVTYICGVPQEKITFLRSNELPAETANGLAEVNAKKFCC